MTRASIDFAKELWTGTGTGNLVLEGAVAGWQAFTSALDQQKVSYGIEHENGAEREGGLGTWTNSTRTLSRDLVSWSTSGPGTKHNFTAGAKHVRIAPLTYDIIENRATTDPTATDDIGAGYIAGRSRWLNTSTSQLWICISHAAGTAVWKRVTNWTAAELLSLLLTVDGASSGLDADLLDGLSSAAFATAAQGAKADTAVQPASLAPVATTGVYSDLTGKPTLGTAADNAEGDFASAAQGALAASALQLGAVAGVQTFANTSGSFSPTAVKDVNIIFVTGTLTATLTATLPAASASANRQMLFHRTGGGQFDLVAGPKTARKGERIWLISDGSAWQAIEDRRPAQVRLTTSTVELTYGDHAGRKVTLTSTSNLTVTLRDDYPTDSNFILTVEPAMSERTLTFVPTGTGSVAAAINPLTIPANMPYELYLYVDANSDGVSAVTQVYDRSGNALVRERSGTGARTLGPADVNSQQRNSSGIATWTIAQFVGSIFVDNFDGDTITLAPGAGVSLTDTSIAAGKFATLIGRVSGTNVRVVEAP